MLGKSSTSSTFRALATDYDGTLAVEGRVSAGTLEALERLRAAGWRLVLVTGRELGDLRQVFPEIGVCHLVVAENGGVLHRPAGGEVEVLGAAPGAPLLPALRAAGVRFTVGRAAVFTVVEFEREVRAAVARTGAEVTLSLNKGALMLLPAGVDKASGLLAALRELRLPPASVVGVGDAENDEPFLSLCGLSVAVASALRGLRERVDVVTAGGADAGVRELVERLLAGEDLRPGRR